MKINLSKILGIGLLLAMGTSLQGCTDEEVAAGVGLAAIGAAIVIIGDNDHGYDNGRGHGRDHGRRGGRCEGGYVNRCTTYRDYYGHQRRECRREWDSCSRYRNYSNDNVALLADHLNGLESANDIQLAAASKEEEKVSSGKLAATFEMSFKSADFMVTSLEQARAGNPKALLNLGLDRRDIELIANEKMPSARGTDTLAKKLNMDTPKAESMLKSLLDEGKELNKKKCHRIGRPGSGRQICRAS